MVGESGSGVQLLGHTSVRGPVTRAHLSMFFHKLDSFDKTRGFIDTFFRGSVSRAHLSLFFGVFGAMPDQKQMFSRCLGGFLMGYKKFCSLPKNGQIFGQILAFLAHLMPCPIKKITNKVPRWFSDVRTKTFAPPLKS